MTAREIAMMLLTDSGCDLWCYQNDYDNALKDVAYLIDNEGREFDRPTEEIAQALVEIAAENPKPVEPVKRFEMIYDTDSFDGGTDHETFEKTMDAALETLIFWEQCEVENWKFDNNGRPIPTEKQIEDWDYMYWNCSVRVVEKDENGEIVNEWYPSDEDLDSVGWMLWEDFEKTL